MSVDDVLFEPIHSILPWREQCRAITTYIEKHGELLRPMRKTLELSRPRPDGALLLEGVMELYHEKGQREFFYAIITTQSKTVFSLSFDGTLIFGRYEDGKVPVLGNFDGRRSIRDLNLVANTYTKHYVFASSSEARHYIGTLA